MADDERTDDEPKGDAVDGADDERDPLIGPEARFTIGGKPLPLDEFITSTTGGLADREPAAAEPQPAGQPKQVVWASRRPL